MSKIGMASRVLLVVSVIAMLTLAVLGNWWAFALFLPLILAMIGISHDRIKSGNE